MLYQTNIFGAESTWNPVDGCTKVSDGCRNCYVEDIAKHYWNNRGFNEVRCHPDRLTIPLTWKSPKMVFLSSMGDLYHPEVPSPFIRDIFRTIIQVPQHIFMILTKRPERMYGICLEPWLNNVVKNNKNIWLGVSCENQEMLERRVPILLKMPSVVKFVCLEPLLCEINLTQYLGNDKINWVIAGGETGSHCRPSVPPWFRTIRDQCLDASVPFFFNQWHDSFSIKIHVGRTIDGKEWNQIPHI